MTAKKELSLALRLGLKGNKDFSIRAAITISIGARFVAGKPARCNGGCPPGAAPSAGQTKGVAEMDIGELVNVRVSPFDVSTRLDIGYRASNSVSASRFDAPISDLPFAIQAFTEPSSRTRSR